jgi:hypothetical protein
MLSILKRPSQATQELYQKKKENKAHLIEILSCLNKKCSPGDIQKFLEVIKSVQKAVNEGKSFGDIEKEFFARLQACNALDAAHIKENFQMV